MSYKTTPAFVHVGSWDDEMRSHPALKWMEHYTKDIIDGRKFDLSATSAGHTEDWVLQKSNGEVIEGADTAWKVLATEVYAPFSAHVHDPSFLVTWETEKGWDMFGVAQLWWNLKVPGEQKIKGYGGREWDGCTPSAFYFKFVKDGDDRVLSARTEIYSDPSAAMVQMMKRGMLKPEELAQM